MKHLIKNVMRCGCRGPVRRTGAVVGRGGAYSAEACPPEAGKATKAGSPRRFVVEIDRRDEPSRPTNDQVGRGGSPRRLHTIAFTLIEVMIAVAVVTLGIVAVLGLIPVGLKSARDAADNTLAATIAQDIFSQLRARPFGPITIYTNCENTLFTTVDLTGSGQASWSYTQDGYLPCAAATPYYRVALAYANTIPSLSRVTATVVCPAQSANPPNINIFVTEIAQYQ